MGASWPVVSSPAASRGLRPRCVGRVNGQLCSILKARVTNKKHFGADTFEAHLEPWQQPEGFGLQYWVDEAPGGGTFEVLAGYLDPTADVSAQPASPTSLIAGIYDDMACDPLKGTLTITGRDQTAKLIDQKISNKWPQQTSSQIVSRLATQAGLTPDVTATSTPAGEYYRTAYGQLARSLPIWDLVKLLAVNEGFDAYVTGSTLYFGPPNDGNSAGPLSLVIGRDENGAIVSNANVLTFHRKLTLAQNLSVNVLSHHTAKGTAVKANASRAAKGGGSGTQAYSISRPNRSQQQAQQLANNMLGELAQHEFGLVAVMDPDLTFNARRQVRLSGTGTSLDTVYEVAELSWDWDSGDGGGLKMGFSLKLAPPAGSAGSDDPLEPSGASGSAAEAEAP